MYIPSDEHQQLVAALIKHFRDNLGYEILGAEYPGFTSPAAHGRHAPDIVAKDKNGVLHLAEAKLIDDFSSERTKEQFIDFSNRIMKGTNIPVIFDVITYKQHEPNLIAKLNELGLGNRISSRIKIWTL